MLKHLVVEFVHKRMESVESDETLNVIFCFILLGIAIADDFGLKTLDLPFSFACIGFGKQRSWYDSLSLHVLQQLKNDKMKLELAYVLLIYVLLFVQFAKFHMISGISLLFVTQLEWDLLDELEAAWG